MDKEDEVFDLVNEDDEIVGQEFRGIVHKKGLLHRAVYCWVFNSDGKLLLQKRSILKNIGPGQWDLSAAEHLQPNETYQQAAVRGLKEELNISVTIDRLMGPVNDTHRRELHQDEFHDVELVRSYVLKDYDGPVHFDDGEVEDAIWVELSALKSLVDSSPDEYTQWMKEEGESLGWAF